MAKKREKRRKKTYREYLESIKNELEREMEIRKQRRRRAS